MAFFESLVDRAKGATKTPYTAGYRKPPTTPDFVIYA